MRGPVALASVFLLSALATFVAAADAGSDIVVDAHIEEYRFGNWVNHDPRAKRKLMLNHSEIRKLFGLAAIKGHALVPLSLYWKNGKVKVKLAVGKGKVDYDKREDIRKRDSDRELKRVMMQHVKGKAS